MLSKIQSVRRTLLRVTDSIQMDNGITCPCITGQVSQVGVISQNGYRYNLGFWDIINTPEFQERVESRDLLGTIEHPTDDAEYLRTPYEKASHVAVKSWLDGEGNPYATFALLNNDKGNAIKALVDVGHKPGVSTRGLGDIVKDATSEFVSPEGYQIISWDIVRAPNFQSLHLDKVSDSLMASPLFKEVCGMYQVRDSIETQTGVSKEVILKEIADGIKALQEKYDSLLKVL